VVEMEVAVDDDADVRGRHPGVGERVIQGTAHRVVRLLHLLVALGDARVEQDEPVRMVDQVAADDDLLPSSRIPVVGDREVTEQDAPDAVEWDHGEAL
jgi:hypothetical protein